MGLDTCFDALRFLARSSELEATRLMRPELRINELLEQVKLKPAAFWHAISEYIGSRQATLGDD
jgi:hypothetical protein